MALIRNKAKIYAAALMGALRQAPEKAPEAIAGLRTVLKRRGDLKIARQVINEVRERLRREQGEPAEVLFAHEPKAAEQALAQFLEARQLSVETVVDSSLIGGVKIIIGNKLLIDGSVKGKLQRLQRLLSSWTHNIL